MGIASNSSAYPYGPRVVVYFTLLAAGTELTCHTHLHLLLLPAFKVQSPDLVPAGWAKSTASGPKASCAAETIARYSRYQGRGSESTRPACRGSGQELQFLSIAAGLIATNKFPSRRGAASSVVNSQLFCLAYHCIALQSQIHRRSTPRNEHPFEEAHSSP